MVKEFGVCGAYFDLDGHFGNSIEDSRSVQPLVGKLILAGKIHYVVFAHGADSHQDDDIGGDIPMYLFSFDIICSGIFWFDQQEFVLNCNIKPVI